MMSTFKCRSVKTKNDKIIQKGGDRKKKVKGLIQEIKAIQEMKTYMDDP